MKPPPSLPNAPAQYERPWADSLLNALRLYLAERARPGPLQATTLTLTDLPGATTLATSISNVQNTIPLTSAALFPLAGSGTINNAEKFSWTGKTGNTLTGVVRGIAGTVAVAAAAGVVVVSSATTGAVYAQPNTGLLAVLS